jgi:hypothetical protein
MQRSSTGVCAMDILLNQKSRQTDSRFDPHMTRRCCATNLDLLPPWSRRTHGRHRGRPLASTKPNNVCSGFALPLSLAPRSQVPSANQTTCGLVQSMESFRDIYLKFTDHIFWSNDGRPSRPKMEFLRRQFDKALSFEIALALKSKGL